MSLLSRFFLLGVFTVWTLVYSENSGSSKFYEKLYPEFYKLQTAGNTGWLSIGFGYQSFKEHWETEFLYGYLPSFVGGVSIHSTSVRGTLIPIQFPRTGKFSISPLMGSGLHIAYGDEYVFVIEDRYRDYYWPSAFTISLYSGLRVCQEFPLHPWLRNIQFQAEGGTLTAYLTSYFEERAIKLEDILGISFSLKMDIGSP